MIAHCTPSFIWNFKHNRTLCEYLPKGERLSNVLTGVAATVGAFVNTKGGSVYIGVCDDGRVCGIRAADVDSLVLRVQNSILSRLDPRDAGRHIQILTHSVGFPRIPSPDLAERPDHVDKYTIQLENLVEDLKEQLERTGTLSKSRDEVPLVVLEVRVQLAETLVMMDGHFRKRRERQNVDMTRDEIRDYFRSE